MDQTLKQDGLAASPQATSTPGSVRVADAPSLPLEPVVLLERARALVPALRERIAETEQLRRLPEATLQDAADAGILSLLVPRSRGGAAGGLAEYVELLRILASGDPSVAWTLGFFTAHNWLLGRWPAEAQEEFFGNGCPTRMAGVANPPGRAEATAGGYLVTGYWGYCSGVMHADWVQVAALDDQKNARLFMLPRDEVEVVDTWHTNGMRGTGSHHVKLDSVFVPEHRSLSSDLWRTRHNPGSALHPEAIYSYDIRDFIVFLIPAVIVGAAEVLLTDYRERLETRREVLTGTLSGDTVTRQVRYANAVAAMRAARAVLDGAVVETMAFNAREAESMSDEMRAQIKLDCLSAVRFAWESIELGVGGSGTAIYKTSDVTQHFIRDTQIAISHLTIDRDVMTAQAALILLGRATDPDPARHFL
jgi:alkylation response protein AidB-like acyl-CoA dehydrogenase